MCMPTSEECAQEMLQMFINGHIRPGEYLPIQFIEETLSTRRTDDVNRGLEYGYHLLEVSFRFHGALGSTRLLED